ncbi:unnamed protein product [Polarella glacialis]|uniref:AMP-dependent synthetase/ligase domain-containing protein n=1 Tax=Polarella glacialis TaxID=89957 RepID=A0A813JKU2_POLGL|nr:unnamed protein product [Polarella glacialis]
MPAAVETPMERPKASTSHHRALRPNASPRVSLARTAPGKLYWLLFCLFPVTQRGHPGGSPGSMAAASAMAGTVKALCRDPFGPTRRCASSLASLVSSHAAAAPDRLALAAPQQGLSWSFGELEDRAEHVAAALAARGYVRGHSLVTDLPNSAENLLLQVACSRLGVAVATAKDEAAVKELVSKRSLMGAVAHRPSSSESEALPSLLVQCQLPLPPFLVEELDGSLAAFQDGRCPDAVKVYDATPLGYWSSTTALTNGEAISVMGAAARDRLAMTAEDRVLVGITLCHAFGIGSAVGGAWLAGAAVVLPGASGIRGCGSPSQRAEATLACLASQRCTLLFADVHTLKALPLPGPGVDVSALRGGVCKVGSGSTFLEDVREAKLGPENELRPLEYAGVRLVAIGKL